MGVAFSVLNLSTLTNVPPQSKGIATSMVAFFRSVGTALGITVLGAIQKHEFQSGAKAVVGDNAQLFEKVKSGQELLSPQASRFLEPALLERLVGVLADSIVQLFQWTIVLPVLAFVFVLLMGNARAVARQAPASGQVTGEAEPAAADKG